MELFIALYILMAIFLYAKMRAITSFSSLHCFVIALTSSIPYIFRMVSNSIQLASDLLVELGLMLGGTSSKELLAELIMKMENEPEDYSEGDR